MIIHQTLYSLFPPSSFNAALIAPLTPTEFIQRVLVPEAAVGLILEDRHLDWANEKHRVSAMRILSESAAYGVAMFPDADTSGKGKGDDDWVMGAGDEIMRERARVRRKELEKEERLEDELWVARESERALEEKAAKKKAKNLERDNDRKKDTRKGKAPAKAKDLELAGPSKPGTRRRPPPRDVHSDVGSSNLDSDIPISGSEEPTRRRKAQKNGSGSKSSSRAAVDLCSDSSSAEDSQNTTSKVKVKQKGKAVRSISGLDPDNHRRVDSTRRSRSRSVASTRSAESASLQGSGNRGRHRGAVDISSGEERTPRAGKLKPASATSSKNSYTSITKGLQPLQIARNRGDQR